MDPEEKLQSEDKTAADSHDLPGQNGTTDTAGTDDTVAVDTVERMPLATEDSADESPDGMEEYDPD